MNPFEDESVKKATNLNSVYTEDNLWNDSINDNNITKDDYAEIENDNFSTNNQEKQQKNPYLSNPYDDKNNNPYILNNDLNDNNNNNNQMNLPNNIYNDDNTSNNNNNNNDNNSNFNSNLSHTDLDRREEILRKKEKELQIRKQRLDNAEKEISSSDIQEDNWPCKYYPVTYHSIIQEIPPFARPHMRRMYTLVLVTFLTLFWNMCAEFGMYLFDAAEGTDLILACTYFALGIFGAWKGWYRQIYYAIRDRRTFKWLVFFFMFFVHTCFCLIMFLAPDAWPPGAGGIWIISDTFKKSAGVGICNLVAALLWLFVASGSVFYMRKSWRIYRTRGGLEQATNEFTSSAVKYAANNPDQVSKLIV